MSQDSTQYLSKQHQPRQTITDRQQNNEQVLVAQRPASDDAKAWKAYWKAQGQPWRTEPEIGEDRQRYLAERRAIRPDIEQGIYPFKDVKPKLTRADIEWLLATHKNGQGPVEWSDESQRNREGLDLRGAFLNEQNLSGLPLACMLGGIGARRQITPTGEPIFNTSEQRDMAAVHMEGANLEDAHLEGANLSRGHLNKAKIRRAHLENAELIYAHLEEAFLTDAHLERALLSGCHLEGAILYKAHVAGAKLKRAFFNNDTNLESIHWWDEENGCASLADLRWNDANLTVVDWSQVKILGDEYGLRKQNTDAGRTKDRATQIKELQTALRANHQLAVALQAQGLNEDAARFAYRAQVVQRKVFWYRRKFGKYIFSLLLDILTGYGYKPARSFLAYVLVIGIFATIYHLLTASLTWNEAIVISMTAFHGRGFFPDQFHAGDPQAFVAAIEAFVGLLIEVTFIATLTRRLFGQ